MDKLTAIFDKLDLSKLAPQMDKLLSLMHFIASAAILIGPVVMVALGVWYLFLPPKEANHHAGFRTYFGMGSVDAWLFTQKLAGIAIGSAGVILGIIMSIICSGYSGRDVMDVALSALKCLIGQAAVIFVIYFGISITDMIIFDAKGNRRFKKEEE